MQKNNFKISKNKNLVHNGFNTYVKYIWFHGYIMVKCS